MAPTFLVPGDPLTRGWGSPVSDHPGFSVADRLELGPVCENVQPLLPRKAKWKGIRSRIHPFLVV